MNAAAIGRDVASGLLERGAAALIEPIRMSEPDNVNPNPNRTERAGRRAVVGSGHGPRCWSSVRRGTRSRGCQPGGAISSASRKATNSPVAAAMAVFRLSGMLPGAYR